MTNEIPFSEVDNFLPEDVGHWKTMEYDVFIIKAAEDAAGSVVILCRPSWDYGETIEKIKAAKGMEAWNTSFKFTDRRDQSFFYLKNGRSIDGDGMRFIAIDRTNAEFLRETVQPLADAGFIPTAAAEWFKNHE